MSARRIASRRNVGDRLIQTIVDIDGGRVIPIPESEPMLVRLLKRARRFSPFMWGVITGVAVMSVLVALVALLLFYVVSR